MWLTCALRAAEICPIKRIGSLATVSCVRRALPGICKIVLSKLTERVWHRDVLGLLFGHRMRIYWGFSPCRVIAITHRRLVTRSRRGWHVGAGRSAGGPTLACSKRGLGTLPRIFRSRGGGRRRCFRTRLWLGPHFLKCRGRGLLGLCAAAGGPRRSSCGWPSS